MDSKKLALLCRKLADNRKAENLQVLDVRELSSVTDFYVLADRQRRIREWLPEVREKYDLEGLWSDAPRLKTRKTKPPAAE